MITGTFLPWVDSGRVARNVYAATGVAERLGLLGPSSPLVTAISLVGPACLVPVLLAALRWRRSSAVTAIVIALGCAGATVAVLALGAGRSFAGVGLAYAGPLTVLAGAAVVTTAALRIVRRRGRPAPRLGVSPLHWGAATGLQYEQDPLAHPNQTSSSEG